MAKAENVSKKLVPIPENILADVLKAAIKDNTSTNKFIEEALKHAVQLSSLGITSLQFINICEVAKDCRVLGCSFIPMGVLRYLTHRACNDDKIMLQAKWYDSGVWYGKFLSEKFDDPLEGFKEFLLATRWDLNEVEVMRYGESVKLRCISNALSIEETELLVKFIDGVMHGMCYLEGKIDYVKGIASFEYKNKILNFSLLKA